MKTCNECGIRKQLSDFPKSQRNPKTGKRKGDGYRRAGADGEITEGDVEAVWKRWDGKCWVCGYQAEEVNHVCPINGGAGGHNSPDNIRPICMECNQKRSHKWHGDDVTKKEAALLRQIKELLNE